MKTSEFYLRITIINYEDTTISYTPEGAYFSERKKAIEGGAFAFKCTPRAVKVEVFQSGVSGAIAQFNSRHLNYSANTLADKHFLN
jgi:hypothetical protein